MPAIRAALFDFGGVISSSPFEAFAAYERDQGLPDGFLRGLNATNHNTNAWARHERNEVTFDEFCDAYEAEALEAGSKIDARAVMGCLAGEIRPEMIEAIKRCHERLKTALITNNIVAMTEGDSTMLTIVDGLFDVIIESSKTGLRKPDPRIYEMACDQLGVAAAEIVFLDDLGINLKPAAQMGMTTIKVGDPDEALAALEEAVGFPVR
ncbi:MAG TPA: HAD-IA family hydrolase [Acidimicrobiales bacterium]|jgi:putative hydrolase of the HAD superfamily